MRLFALNSADGTPHVTLAERDILFIYCDVNSPRLVVAAAHPLVTTYYMSFSYPSQAEATATFDMFRQSEATQTTQWYRGCSNALLYIPRIRAVTFLLLAQGGHHEAIDFSFWGSELTFMAVFPQQIGAAATFQDVQRALREHSGDGDGDNDDDGSSDDGGALPPAA